MKYINFTEVANDESETASEENEVMKITGFNQNQSGKILKVAKEKIEIVREAFNYAVKKGADNLYTYTVWGIKNINKIRETASTINDYRKTYTPKTKFDNFESREYDYDDLEKRLLGWV